MFGRRNKEEDQNRSRPAHETAEDIYRGPGLYAKDMQTIESGLLELKNFLLPSQNKPSEETNKLIKMVIDGVLKINSEMQIRFADVQESLKQITQTAPKQAVKFDKLATTDALKGLENSMTLRFQALQSIVETAATEIRQSVASGESVRTGFPGGAPKQNKNAPLAVKPEDPTNYLDKVKKRYGSELLIMGRRFNLSQTKRDTFWWEIKRLPQTDAQRKRILSAFVVLGTNRKSDLEVLTEIRGILTKYLNPSDKNFDKETICLIFTFGSTEHLNLDVSEWVKSGVGLFPVESLTYLIALWREFDSEINKLFAYKTPPPDSDDEDQPESEKSGDQPQPDENESNEPDVIPDEIASQAVSIDTDSSPDESVDESEEEAAEDELSEENYRYETDD